MMHVNCPYCTRRMRVENAAAGRYRPSCTRCQNYFLLVISDPELPPMVSPLARQPAKRKPKP